MESQQLGGEFWVSDGKLSEVGHLANVLGCKLGSEGFLELSRQVG